MYLLPARDTIGCPISLTLYHPVIGVLIYYMSCKAEKKNASVTGIKSTHLPSRAASSSKSDGLRFVFRVNAANIPLRFVAQHIRSITRIRINTAPTAMPTMAPDDNTVSLTRNTTSAPEIRNLFEKPSKSTSTPHRIGSVNLHATVLNRRGERCRVGDSPPPPPDCIQFRLRNAGESASN